MPSQAPASISHTPLAQALRLSLPLPLPLCLLLLGAPHARPQPCHMSAADSLLRYRGISEGHHHPPPHLLKGPEIALPTLSPSPTPSSDPVSLALQPHITYLCVCLFIPISSWRISGSLQKHNLRGGSALERNGPGSEPAGGVQTPIFTY